MSTHSYAELGSIKEARKVIQYSGRGPQNLLLDFSITETKNLVGYDSVDMKSAPSWSTVMMKGRETATHHLRRLIKESLVQEYTVFPGPAICPMCFEEQQHAEMLGCADLHRTSNVPISLPFIRRFLPRHAAFVSYRQQPANEAAIITCLACSARTCSSCSEYHENMTCAEYRILNDDKQERLNADNSIKNVLVVLFGWRKWVAAII